ncbi:hypothetical protein C7379_11046 [Hallella colorans]|uniref:Uncharacterized protein n=1 Tax=Hallella colorans TaxID=1703337 RepID=A0A2U0U7J4_9BACT|nr:hypothetical protein C7379_11046 [Hallella colorans]
MNTQSQHRKYEFLKEKLKNLYNLLYNCIIQNTSIFRVFTSKHAIVWK